MSSCYDLKFNPIMEPEQITYREDMRKQSIFRLKTIFPVRCYIPSDLKNMRPVFS